MEGQETLEVTQRSPTSPIYTSFFIVIGCFGSEESQSYYYETPSYPEQWCERLFTFISEGE